MAGDRVRRACCIASTALLLLVSAIAVAGCGGGGGDDGGDQSDARSKALLEGNGLTVGIAEANPNLFTASKVPTAFEPWRDQVAQIHPGIYRLIVDWAHLQPDPSVPAELRANVTGCMRDIGPCAPYQGVEETLRALAQRQREGPGWSVVVTVYGVPDWAAVPGHGCERPSIEPRSRPITARGLQQYRALIRGIAKLGDDVGADLRFWSPWNEPNEIFFISPQRAKCDVGSPALSPAVYARLFRAASDELEKAPGDQKLVLGDLSGPAEPEERSADVPEFIAALPQDVVCGADVLAQHQYIGSPVDAVREARDALDARSCDHRIPVWVSETGVGQDKPGNSRPTGEDAQRLQCRRYQAQLRRWQRDPRIRAVIQYTVREDPGFRVGLVDSRLRRSYPTLDLLEAWGRRAPDDPAPSLPASCQT